MLINRAAVKKFVGLRDKKITKLALFSLDRAVAQTLEQAIKSSKHFKTINDPEISYSLVKGK